MLSLSLRWSNGEITYTDETNISNDIVSASDEVAGSGKGISNTPLTLTVKRNGIPDLTMVDLPGITRVPVHGQPEDIYDQIRDIIMEYITPQESIILNVLSATVDFPTCESIRMSRSVDKTGKRTLAVVTKCDKAPEGLLEKVTADDVSIELGYVCVRNRVGNETYEEARKEEATLFGSHPLLSKMDKSIVGIPNLAQKLVQIQATSLARCLPDIVKQINQKLSANTMELNRMPKKLSSIEEAMTTFMQIIGQAKESLRKILLRGEYDEYPDDEKMHGTSWLVEMLKQYSIELHECVEINGTENFLKEEIMVLEQSRRISLPNFLPHGAFLSILKRKVETISQIPIDFVENVWSYIQEVVLSVLMFHAENYIQLHTPIKRAGQNLVEKMREHSVKLMEEVVEMEKLTDYTSDPGYMAECTRLVAEQDSFIREVTNGCPQVTVEGFGVVEVGDLRQFESVLPQAFDMKMRMTAYWKIVQRRIVDFTTLHLQCNIQNLINKKMGRETMGELKNPAGGGIERMLEESPSIVIKREKLKNSIKLLEESKVIVANIVDAYGA